MNRSETIGKISAALVKAQSEMGNAVKGATNPFFKSKFADLNAVREAAIPVLNKHGISVWQPTTEINGKLYVETIFVHETGEFISGLYEVVVGKQNDPQAFGAAVSYSRRYSLQAMANLGAEDDDAESAMGRNVKAAPTKPTTNTKELSIPKDAPTGHFADPAEKTEAPIKKGGFGVKKTEVVTAGSEDGWA